MMNECFKELINAVIVRAAEDYIYLRENDLSSYRDRGSKHAYSIEEIERFFNSKWGNALIDSTDLHISGSDILSKLQKQFA